MVPRLRRHHRHRRALLLLLLLLVVQSAVVVHRVLVVVVVVWRHEGVLLLLLLVVRLLLLLWRHCAMGRIARRICACVTANVLLLRPSRTRICVRVPVCCRNVLLRRQTRGGSDTSKIGRRRQVWRPRTNRMMIMSRSTAMPAAGGVGGGGGGGILRPRLHPQVPTATGGLNCACSARSRTRTGRGGVPKGFHPRRDPQAISGSGFGIFGNGRNDQREWTDDRWTE